MTPFRSLLIATALFLPVSPPALSAGMPGEFPVLSVRPEVAQNQAVGCGLVGFTAAGIALATGAVATVGTGGIAAPATTVVGELLAYFGAGCSVGAYLAGGLSTPAPTAEADLPALPEFRDRRPKIEAAVLVD